MLLYCLNWFGALIKRELRHRRSVLEIKESLVISVDVGIKRRNLSQIPRGIFLRFLGK
jgi:hypothetical protein